MDEGILRTIGLCQLLHADTTDRSGEPYWKHPIRVMIRCRPASNDRNTALVSLLHDVLEDCNITTQDLLDLGYSQSVVDRVYHLTNTREVETGSLSQFEKLNNYRYYINKLLEQDDRILRVIKLADIADNSSPDRLSGLTPFSAFKYRIALKQFEDYPDEPVTKGPVSLGYLSEPVNNHIQYWKEKLYG